MLKVSKGFSDKIRPNSKFDTRCITEKTDEINERIAGNIRRSEKEIDKAKQKVKKMGRVY